MTTNRNNPAQTGNDIYERVTTQIIAASRKAYRGVNVIALRAAARGATTYIAVARERANVASRPIRAA